MNSNSETVRKADLDPAGLPAHVAVIMDGNGRWAKKRMLNRIKGHEKGSDTVREIVRTAREVGVPILTLYAFSTENWNRPKAEVTALMALLTRFLKSERREMLDNNIRFNVIGEIERLPEKVQEAIQDTRAATQENDGMLLNLALSYGSRAEILRMTRAVAAKARAGEIDPNEISFQTVADHLYTRGMADPDLLIRTSGEHRISNFLLWQIAYAELFFTDTLWPDFGREEFIHILKEYQHRERRFGKVDATDTTRT
ncbi:MAG: isoprenyl transferase [Desulfococcaceae bacterium]